ncbi:MAG TPA: AAA family ATPase, partial [Terriglobales bacterium]|nr:AAA family ATPase [Terriglobales bacterium]
ALLEALFLTAGGSPELALRLRAQRGLGQPIQVTLDRASYESLWQDLFYELDASNVISSRIAGSPNNTRSLAIAYEAQQSLRIPLTHGGMDSTLIAPISFTWKDSTGKEFTTQPRITAEGLEIKAPFEVLPVALFSSAASAPNPTETANRFSDLSKQNREKVVVETLQKEFPYIQSLSLETNAGILMVYASVATMKQKVPIGMVSGGVNKHLSILLAIANLRHGIVLIDEIENGFYYERLLPLWRTLLKFCDQFDVQLFASTHSLECLRAALSSLEGHEQDFSLIRLEREDRECTAKLFSGRQLESAILHEIEVR